MLSGDPVGAVNLQKAMAVLLTGLVLIVLSLVAGWIIARISFRLPQNPEPVKARRYWVLPLACAAIAAIATAWSHYHQYGVLAAVFTTVLGWQLLLVGIVDAENFWLPDVLTIPLALTGLAANVFLEPPLGQGWMVSVLSALFAFCGLWLLAFIYKLVRKKKGMGAGDPILLAAGCAWVGFAKVLNVLLWSSASALVLIIVLRLMKKDVGFGTRIPFGTFLALGVWMSWLL